MTTTSTEADLMAALQAERPPYITIRCDEPGCGTEFYGELSRWWAVYTGGEDWNETCPGCRQQFDVTLRFRRRKRLPAGEQLPASAVLLGSQ